MDTECTGQDPDVLEVAAEEKSTKKKNERERKKGEKKIDQYMKSISNLTSDEKIDALCKRNTDCFETIRTYKGSVQLLQRRIQVLEREKVQLTNDQGKTVLAKSRLETLCRELQRQNKSIKDESLQTIREEEEKRKEMSNRFQTALNEVTQMMQENTEKNLKLREDNILISHKFQTLCEKFKLREDEVSRLSTQIDLEKELSDATINRIECELSAEKEMWKKEKGYLLEQLKLSEDERLKLKTNISNLEEHLAMYSTRYEEFETTITKSNKVFDSYKVEMARLGKQVNKLENDCHSWQERWIQSQQQLKRAQAYSKTQELNLLDRDKKLNKLTSLCRSIQEERSTYLKQLKENGVVPIAASLPVLTPLADVLVTPDTKTSHKLTKKEKELSKLKKQVDALETQLVGAVTLDIKNHDNAENTKESHTQETIIEPPSSAEQTTSVSVQAPVESKTEQNDIAANSFDQFKEESKTWPTSNSPDIIDLSMDMSAQQIIESISKLVIDYPEAPNSIMNSSDQPDVESKIEPIKQDTVNEALKCALRDIANSCDKNLDVVNISTIELTKNDPIIIPEVKENGTEEKNAAPISTDNQQNNKDQAYKSKQTKGRNSKKKNKK